MSGNNRGETASLIKLAAFSSRAKGFTIPRTWRVWSSTPMSIVPPAVLAKATMERRKGLGEDRSRLNSRVLPSGWRRISVRSIARKITRKHSEGKVLPSSGQLGLRRGRLAEILAEREGFEPSMSYQPILP